MGNKVVHFEINAPDAESDAKFYAELFGWHVESFPEMNYVMVDTHGGGGINGGIGSNPDAPPSTTFYIEVPGVKSTLEALEKTGAKTIVPETEIPNVVTFGVFADPQGAVLGLVQAGEGPGVSAGGNPPVDYFEILSGDPKAQWDFYRGNFGWEIEGGGESSAQPYVYGHVHAGESTAEGGIGSSPDGTPRVMVYARVDDVTKYLERAESLGAKRLYHPMNPNPGLTVAAFIDPQGAPFGLYGVSS